MESNWFVLTESDLLQNCLCKNIKIPAANTQALAEISIAELKNQTKF